MGSRRLVVLLVLAVALIVEGRPKHSIWEMFGYQGDEAPAKVQSGNGHKSHHHSAHHDDDDTPMNPYTRFFGPIRTSHNSEFKKMTKLFWHDHENHKGDGAPVVICYDTRPH